MDMRIGYRTYTCEDKWEIVGTIHVSVRELGVLHSQCDNTNKSFKGTLGLLSVI